MMRKIISIDEEKCNGCGLCITACHEGALELVNGKAKLVSDEYCDGLGACLPECPTGAIEMIERYAADFDEAAVAKRLEQLGKHAAPEIEPAAPLACGCPGKQARLITRDEAAAPAVAAHNSPAKSSLCQWPVQIKLVPVGAPYLANAHLLVAADCTAFAYANIHRDFMRNKITLIGCPKLDEGDYAEKLAAILKAHEIKSVTVLRMEVPCCGGIASAVKRALVASGKMIPWSVVTIGTDGSIVED